MIENPRVLRARLEVALCSLEHVAWNEIAIVPRSVDGLIEAVLNSKFGVKDSAKSLLQKAQLKPRHASQMVELVLWSPAELGVDGEWSMTDVRRRMQLLNLSFCTLEMALEVSLGLPEIEIKGDKFIPFTTDDEDRGGVLGIGGNFFGDETELRYEMSCFSLDYWRKISFNPDMPLILVRQLSGLDTAELSRVFSEALCNSLNINSGMRTRVLRTFVKENFKILADLLECKESYLRLIPNFGNSALEAVRKVLSHYGLGLER